MRKIKVITTLLMIYLIFFFIKLCPFANADVMGITQRFRVRK